MIAHNKSKNKIINHTNFIYMCVHVYTAILNRDSQLYLHMYVVIHIYVSITIKRDKKRPWV